MRGGLLACRAVPVLLVPVVFVVAQVGEADSLLLELGAVADVVHEGVEDEAAADERHELDALVEEWTPAMAHEPLDALPMSLAVPLGDDRVSERTTDRLFARPAEGPFSRAVPAGDVPGGVHRHERVIRGVDD